MDPIEARFTRPEPRRRVRDFVAGLLAPLPVKNCWTIAEHAGDDGPGGMQDLIGRASWDDALVRADVRDFVTARLGHPDGVLLVDETGDLPQHLRADTADQLAGGRVPLRPPRVPVQGCVLAAPAFERTAHPAVDPAGGRTPALRFGDPRVMALTGALCHTLLAATGFTNKHLRVLIAGLLGSDYRPNQMTYDLRRLRLSGLVRRLPRSNRYLLTPDGIRIAIFYTKVYHLLLVPLTAVDQPQAPPDLRAALATITGHVDQYAIRARLPRAA
nr:transposase [Actinoplanes palleronii]